MNMMISYQELVRTFLRDSQCVVIIAIIRDVITSKCDVTGCRFDSGCKLYINIRCKY